MNTVVVSYVPLLYSMPTMVEFDDPKDAVRAIDIMAMNIKAPQFKYCAWSNTGAPILVVDEGADEILDHLEWWSEGDIRNWFEIAIIDNGDDGYMVVIAPNVTNSVRRLVGHNDADVVVVAMPLVFKSHTPLRTEVRLIIDRLDSTMFSIADADKLATARHADDIRFVGPVKLNDGPVAFGADISHVVDSL